MTDRNRNQNQPNKEQQQPNAPTSPRHDDDLSEDVKTSERDRLTRDRPSVADDRGVDTDRDRRSFSGDRESDELGSEMENELDFDDDTDDEFGGSSER